MTPVMTHGDTPQLSPGVSSPPVMARHGSSVTVAVDTGGGGGGGGAPAKEAGRLRWLIELGRGGVDVGPSDTGRRSRTFRPAL